MCDAICMYVCLLFRLSLFTGYPQWIKFMISSQQRTNAGKDADRQTDRQTQKMMRHDMAWQRSMMNAEGEKGGGEGGREGKYVREGSAASAKSKKQGR